MPLPGGFPTRVPGTSPTSLNAVRAGAGFHSVIISTLLTRVIDAQSKKWLKISGIIKVYVFATLVLSTKQKRDTYHKKTSPQTKRKPFETLMFEDFRSHRAWTAYLNSFKLNMHDVHNAD